jgi:hypothetical protein
MLRFLGTAFSFFLFPPFLPWPGVVVVVCPVVLLAVVAVGGLLLAAVALAVLLAGMVLVWLENRLLFVVVAGVVVLRRLVLGWLVVVLFSLRVDLLRLWVWLRSVLLPFVPEVCVLCIALLFLGFCCRVC